MYLAFLSINNIYRPRDNLGKLLTRLCCWLDDAAQAIPVHCFCGMWGLISVGFFASPISANGSYGSPLCGIFYAGAYGCETAGKQLLAQIVFALAIIGW